MKKHFIGLALFASTLLCANPNETNYELQLLNSVIPNTKISKYEPSEITGFYKVFLDNGNLFYVNPFNKLMIFGEIWTNSGFSITQNERSQWQQELSKTADIELKKDFKVEDFKKVAKKITYGKGSDRYEFVLFTDPECPYCKVTEEYFEDNKNLDLYVIFAPLSFHANAKDWSLKALSSKDLKQAIKDIKKNKIPEVKITEQAKKEFSEMELMVNKLGVNGTPKIIVIDKKDNQIVKSIDGADIKEIDKFQKENK